MRVVIAGAGSALGDATAAALRAAGHEAIEVGPEQCDLRDFAAVQELAAELGAVDGVVHLVGGWRGGGGLAGQTDEDWDWLQTMLVGTLRNTTRAFVDAVGAAPAGRFAIVSQAGVARPTAGNANYLAAKAAAETWLLAVGHALRDTPATVHVERVVALYSDADAAAYPDRDFSRHTHVDELGGRLAALFD
ncbi:SDR family NAD(P)-dependent oxidoreductase [Micropruina sonneratiae]|uniref:SDR family NAD(P)-dependent oxidoreductase n=1 Tax=Micropruina sonneratiae TaxID=2986940 RepID=UPI00222647EF|nr:SDR family NAD(P)-dependent oxidoreductase [Micropruina sp. KQZ13P-5]MCW3159101.1 SDR family NAD(P)-dependent oxidoreductase [Micropruina sp. KQZ13P-5]